MTKRIITSYSHSERIRNVFQNVAANIRLLGSDIRVEIKLDGTRYWHKNGVLHRDDGPAEELPDGIMRWYQNGYCHRVDGPAITGPGGFKSWWQDDKLHRADGPAIERPNGEKYWYIRGREIAPPDGPEGLS